MGYGLWMQFFDSWQEFNETHTGLNIAKLTKVQWNYKKTNTKTKCCKEFNEIHTGLNIAFAILKREAYNRWRVKCIEVISWSVLSVNPID